MAFLTIALRIASVIPIVVGAIEKLGGNKKGKEKQDAAIDMIGDLIEAIEGATGKDLVNNEQVQEAARKAIDAVVELQNVAKAVASKAAELRQ